MIKQVVKIQNIHCSTDAEAYYYSEWSSLYHISSFGDGHYSLLLRNFQLLHYYMKIVYVQISSLTFLRKRENTLSYLLNYYVAYTRKL